MVQNGTEGGEKTTEGNMVKLRRGENKKASDLVNKQGLTAETAAALLKTRVLNGSVLELIVNSLTKKNTPPEK